MAKSSDICESFEKLKLDCVEESLKNGEDATKLLTEKVLEGLILFSSTKRRPLPQKDFNNGSESECFTTENTPKKPRTQRSLKPDTNARGETPVILSKSETQGDFNNGSKSECFTTENSTPEKPRTQRLASPKPDTNANGETSVILSKTETLIEGKVPITKPVKKLRFIFDGKVLKSPAKSTHSSVSKNSEKPQPPKGKRRAKLHVPPSPPDLPEDIRNRIREVHGTQEVFVIQKSLYESDVKPDQNKVSMPLSQINPDFLRKTEREALDQQKPIGVQFLEPSNTVYTMVLRQWDMPKESGKKSSSYVLRTNWKDVVAANDLKINTVVQIWSFRVADKEDLCMALVVVDGGGSKSSGSSNDREGGNNSSGGSE